MLINWTYLYIFVYFGPVESGDPIIGSYFSFYWLVLLFALAFLLGKRYTPLLRAFKK